MQNLKKNDTNELTYKKKQLHRLRKQTYGYQRGKVVRGRIDWEFGTNKYTPLHLKQIINKDFLHSTRNSAQYSVIT